MTTGWFVCLIENLSWRRAPWRGQEGVDIARSECQFHSSRDVNSVFWARERLKVKLLLVKII